MTYRFRLLLCFVSLVTAFSLNAVAQISPGSVTSAPWPVYVYDTETLQKGNIIISGVSGIGFLADDTNSYSIYSSLDFGITDRLLVSVAASGSSDDSSSWGLDDTILHAKYKVLDGESFDFAVAGMLERLPYMEDGGYSAFDGLVMGIVQKNVGAFGVYGQVGYSSRNQVFEGFGARYDILGRAIVTGNFSHRHEGNFFEDALPEDISGVRSTVYATVYVPVGSRVGLTAAYGRTLLPIHEGDPATSFLTFGLGVRLH
jgi:hypothetical protein